MDTTVRAVTDVDYELEIEAAPEDIEPRLTAALKKQRQGMSMKGFRPGRVPLGLVRKMYGGALAVQVAEEVIGEAFREEVGEKGELEVLGQPRLVDLDFEPEAQASGLKALLKFGVKPAIDLKGFEGGEVTKFVKTFSDADVDEAIEARRENAATLSDAPEGAAVTETDVVVADFQKLDAEGTVLVGQKQEGARINLADPNLRAELREGLIGTAAGETFRLDMPHLHGNDEETDHDGTDGGAHVDHFDVTVTEIQQRELPELDETFIKAQTGGEVETLEDFRSRVRQELERSWERRAQGTLEEKMVEQTVEALDVAVPETLQDLYLDQMIEDLKQQVGGTLPPQFDEAEFRDDQRAMARKRAAWMLVKDQLVEDEGIEVTKEDFDAEFERMADDNLGADAIRAYFVQQPELIQNLGERLLNERVFAALKEHFTVVEKSRADLEGASEEAPSEDA